MSNIKNFGISGVGRELQFGKSGPLLINNNGVFNFRNFLNTTDATITASSVISSGNIELTTGNISLNSVSGSISIGGINVIQRSSSGLPQISGDESVIIPAGTTSRRNSGSVGSIRINTDIANSHYVEFWDGAEWAALSVGGNTALMQQEIDSIELSLGPGINPDGTFNSSGFINNSALNSPTSFTNAIQQISNYLVTKDTLDKIFPHSATGNIIHSSLSGWIQSPPGAVSGVQAYDLGLSALSSKTSTGIMIQTGADEYESRSLVPPLSGISITNSNGVSGNPTFSLIDDLAALENLTSTGYSVRINSSTWTTRNILGTPDNINITDGDGILSNTVINLAPVVQTSSGNLVKITLDGFGRVTGNTAVTASDITSLVNNTYLRLDGTSSMMGALNMGNNVITSVLAPVNGTDAANKNYVDSAIAGLTWKSAVKVATTDPGDLLTSFENGNVVDGISVFTNDRILIKNQTNLAENGIYIIQPTGAPIRSADADTGAELVNATVFVDQGNINSSTGWTQTTDAPITLGTSPIVFSQFSGSGAYNAGVGLALFGNTFNVNLGAGITELPGDEIGVDVASNLALQLTSTATSGQLTFVLDSGSGLSQSASGLTIETGGVTNAMLANSGFVINADSGGIDTVSLGETLFVAGTSIQGITTNRSANNTITISASDASSSQKGVASFTTAQFVVTAGNVELGTIPNANLANSTISFFGNSGSDAVALGETFTITGDGSFITTTVNPVTNTASMLLGTLAVGNGGTGATTHLAGSLLIGNGASAVSTDADLAFNSGTNTLTIGSATIQGAPGSDVTITATATNGDIILLPNGTGQVVIGPAGAGVIAPDAGAALTVTGSTTLTLASGTGDVIMSLSGTANTVTVSGPTAAQYAAAVGAEDLVNKQYVDDAIQSGSATGSIKAIKATVNTSTNGTTNIGAVLPAGATILRVKVQVTSPDTGTATLVVGKVGLTAGYMTAIENDIQSTGLYVAETYIVENPPVQVIATVSGSGGTGGTAVVFVEYQVS